MLNINTNDLLKNCKITMLAHAIMVGFYPELNYEHSWDGYNYNLIGDNNTRGTITFFEDNCVGAFRNENSIRFNKKINYLDFFKGAPDSIIKLAEKETLQYLLIEEENGLSPLITTAFWNCNNAILSNDSLEIFFSNGGELIKNHLLPLNKVIEKLVEYYEMNTSQTYLLNLLFNKIIDNEDKKIFIDSKEILMIGNPEEFDINEVKVSLSELNIFFKD